MPNTRFITRFVKGLIGNTDVQEAEPILTNAEFRSEIENFLQQIEESDFVSRPLSIIPSGTSEGPFVESSNYGIRVYPRLYTHLESIIAKELNRETIPGSWWKIHDITLNTLYTQTTRARVFVLLVRHYYYSSATSATVGTHWMFAGQSGIGQGEFIIREYEIDAYDLTQGMKLIKEFEYGHDTVSNNCYQLLAFGSSTHSTYDYYGNWQLRYWTNKTSPSGQGVEGLFLLSPYGAAGGTVTFYTIEENTYCTSSTKTGWILVERESLPVNNPYCIDVWLEPGNSKLAILTSVSGSSGKCKPPNLDDSPNNGIQVLIYSIPDTYPTNPSTLDGQRVVTNFGQLRWINSDYLSVSGVTDQQSKYLVYDILYAGDSSADTYLTTVFRKVFDEEYILPSSSIFANNIIYQTNETSSAITGMYYQIIPHYTGFLALSITTPVDAINDKPIVEVIDYYKGLVSKGIYHQFDIGSEYEIDEIQKMGFGHVITHAIPTNICGLGQLWPQNKPDYSIPLGTFPQGLKTATSLVSRVSNFLVLDQGIPRVIAAQTNLISGDSNTKVITKGGYQSLTFSTETLHFTYPVTVRGLTFDYDGSLENISFTAQLTVPGTVVSVPIFPSFSTRPTVEVNISNVTQISITGTLTIKQASESIGISNIRVLYSA